MVLSMRCFISSSSSNLAVDLFTNNTALCAPFVVFLVPRRLLINMDHHRRHDYCHNRLQYRDSRLPTAVKVYTVANESRHLLVFGVPKINLHAEVKREFQRYGALAQTALVTDLMAAAGSAVAIEQFTDVYRVVFEKLEHARLAKRFSDAKSFYGGILHVSYAPECESLAEWRQKIEQRMREVQFRVQRNAAAEVAAKAKSEEDNVNDRKQRKRKYDAVLGDFVDAEGGCSQNKNRK